MISDESCENSGFLLKKKVKYLQYIKTSVFFYFINILQYDYIVDQTNAALLNIKLFFQKHKSYRPQTFEQYIIKKKIN